MLKEYATVACPNVFICFAVTDEQIFAEFILRYFEMNYHGIQLQKYITSGVRGNGLLNVSANDFFNISFFIPNLPEQRKIAACLSSLDSLIKSVGQKIDLLRQHKKGLMQKLFPKRGSNVPELRFDGFEGDWEVKQMGDFLYEHKQKSEGKEQVCSVSVSKGVVNQIEHLGRSFSAADTSKYKLVKPYDIVYTKSPTGDFPYGIVKQNRIMENVIVSPLYGVFSPNNQHIGYIINCYFESSTRTNSYLCDIVQKGAKNTIQISNDTFLAKKVLFPTNEDEQRKIALCLSSIDNEIEKYEQKHQALQMHKKGLMQKMFVKIR